MTPSPNDTARYLQPDTSERYEPSVPCPYCFESSGYAARSHPDTWSEPGWAEPDPCRPCPYCDHTGMVPASEVGPDDDRDEDFYDPGYLAALAAEPVVRLKPVMDDAGNWTVQPYELWRDAKGWHDRPAQPRKDAA